MKSKTTLIISLLLFVTSLSAQESTEEKLDRLTRVKCLVKTLITTHTDYSYFGTQLQSGTPYVTSKSTYDKTGNFIVSKIYNNRGTIDSWTSYGYEKPGVINYTAVHNTDGTINVKATMKNSYDDSGRHIEASSFINDTLFIGKDLYGYDDNGYRVSTKTYEADRNDRTLMHLTNSESYKYDNKGRTIETTTHEEGSSNDFTTTFKYGENGNISEKIDNYTGVYKYAANGLCASITYYNRRNEMVYVVKYTYEYFTK